MGIYSTKYITREDALEEIRWKIHSATDEQLASIMFDLFSNQTLNNYSIVASYNKEDGYKNFNSDYWGDED